MKTAQKWRRTGQLTVSGLPGTTIYRKLSYRWLTRECATFGSCGYSTTWLFDTCQSRPSFDSCAWRRAVKITTSSSSDLGSQRGEWCVNLRVSPSVTVDFVCRLSVRLPVPRRGFCFSSDDETSSLSPRHCISSSQVTMHSIVSYNYGARCRRVASLQYRTSNFRRSTLRYVDGLTFSVYCILQFQMSA